MPYPMYYSQLRHGPVGDGKKSFHSRAAKKASLEAEIENGKSTYTGQLTFWGQGLSAELL